VYFLIWIAICVVAVPPRDCNKYTAVHWLVVPERQQDLAGCMYFGELYVSQTDLVVQGETYPKIICQPVKAPE
jgi:hypothetical protein